MRGCQGRIALLITIGAIVGLVAQQGSAAEPTKGMALYRGHCAACHGIDGAGNGPKAAGLTPAPTNFTNAAVMHTLPDSQLERAILVGKPGTAMKGYGTVLSPQEVAAVIKYVRSLGRAQ